MRSTAFPLRVPFLFRRVASAMVVALLMYSAGQQPAEALDGAEVFSAVSPGAVLLEDLDSFGSGIVLTEDGQILTNYHVVAANIELKLRAKIRIGTEIVPTDITDVKVVKVHPKYDLALLEAKAPRGGKFIPAQLVAKDSKTATGAKCFVIGNPGGPDGQALDSSITEGIVSSTARKVGNLDYVQISAAVNPGNSGGPVCDDQGKVLGIVTWKMTEAENIGFAIPVQEFSVTDFIEPKKKKPDLELVKQAEQAGEDYFELAQHALTREDRDLLLAACAECYRVTLEAEPQSAAPYQNLGSVFDEMGEKDLAAKYFEAELRIEPNSPYACHSLGRNLVERNGKDPKVAQRCLDLWWRGVLSNGNQEDVAHCADDIAIYSLNEKKLLPGAYMVRWAEILAKGLPQDRNRAQRARMWADLSGALPADQLRLIRTKNDDFSRAEFEALLAGKPLAMEKPANVAPNASAPALTTAPVKAASADFERVVRDARDKYRPQLAPLAADGEVFPIPAKPNRVLLAGAGWQIVMYFPELSNVGVFNLATAKFDGFIPCEDDKPMFAAGGQTLVIYAPSSQTFHVYDLSTLKETVAKKIDFPERVTFVGMGLLNPNRVFFLRFEPNSDQPLAAFLTLPGFDLVDLSMSSTRYPHVSISAVRDQPELDGCMNEAGSAGMVTQHMSSPGGVNYMEITDHQVVVDYQHVGSGDPGFSGRDDYLIGSHSIFPVKSSENLVLAMPREARQDLFARVAGYSGFVEHNWRMTSKEHARFQLRALPSLDVMAEIAVPKATSTMFAADESHSATRMLASAYCGRIAYVLPEAKKIALFPLASQATEDPSQAATPGKHFERKLHFDPNSVVTVQSGPPGLKYDAKQNSLVWDVPADFKTAQTVKVIIFVQSADGKQDYSVEKIAVP